MRFALSLIVVVGLLAAGLAVLGMRAWEAAGGVTISVHGYFALALGTLFTFALTAGLMALVFYSNRQGYDDGVGAVDEEDDRVE